MSTGSDVLVWVGIVSLAVFLFSSLLAIWIQGPKPDDFLNVIKALLSWKVIAGGLVAVGAHKFGPQIARRLSGESKGQIWWRDVMRFTLSHRRAAMGNDLSVVVVSEGDELLSHIRVTHDNVGLSSEVLGPGVTQYERQYSQVGAAAPGEAHKMVVTATTQLGKQRTAVHSWQDSA